MTHQLPQNLLLRFLVLAQLSLLPLKQHLDVWVLLHLPLLLLLLLLPMMMYLKSLHVLGTNRHQIHTQSLRG